MLDQIRHHIWHVAWASLRWTEEHVAYATTGLCKDARIRESRPCSRQTNIKFTKYVFKSLQRHCWKRACIAGSIADGTCLLQVVLLIAVWCDVAAMTLPQMLRVTSVCEISSTAEHLAVSNLVSGLPSRRGQAPRKYAVISAS